MHCGFFSEIFHLASRGLGAYRLRVLFGDIHARWCMAVIEMKVIIIYVRLARKKDKNCNAIIHLSPDVSYKMLFPAMHVLNTEKKGGYYMAARRY